MAENAPPAGYVRILRQLMMSEYEECITRLRAAGIAYEITDNGDPNEMAAATSTWKSLSGSARRMLSPPEDSCATCPPGPERVVSEMRWAGREFQARGAPAGTHFRTT
jgi:hypothetical protein